MEELTGRLTDVRWRSDDDDSPAVVASVRMGQTLTKTGTNVTVKGPDGVPPLRVDGTYRFLGKWDEHPKYGRQFAFDAYALCQTQDEQGVVAYLMSVCTGIGKARAKALWDAYGTFAVQTLRQDPVAVCQAGLLPMEVAAGAAQDLDDHVRHEATTVALLSLLAGRGFHMGRLLPALIGKWGIGAPDAIREDPYALLLERLPSCGWKRVDRLYLDLGHPPAALRRQALVAVQWIRDESRGDTWVSAERVGKAIEQAVSERNADPLAALRLAIESQWLEVFRDDPGGPWLALRCAWEDEHVAAGKVKELSRWMSGIEMS